MSVDDWAVYVFSYNRGSFLQNAVMSTVFCMPECEVVIVDDCSDESYTKFVLSRLSEAGYSVLSPIADTLAKKTGGLFSNMTLAMRHAAKTGKKYVIFMQDDMQLVRRLLLTDFSDLEDGFKENHNVCQIFACFLPKVNVSHVNTDEAESLPLFYKRHMIDATPKYGSFSAVGVFNVARSQEILPFCATELLNNERLKNLKFELLYYRNPFLTWLPFPKSHRNKERSLAHRLYEWLGGSGLHPVQYMSDAEVQALKVSKETPYAEDWLFSQSAPKARLWSTVGGRSNIGRRFNIPPIKRWRG